MRERHDSPLKYTKLAALGEYRIRLRRQESCNTDGSRLGIKVWPLGGGRALQVEWITEGGGRANSSARCPSG